VIYRYNYSRRFIRNEELKNKKIVKALIEKYKIKRVVMLTYYLQANDLVKRNHIAVVNILIKMIVDENKE
jgi:hypothetical protein